MRTGSPLQEDNEVRPHVELSARTVSEIAAALQSLQQASTPGERRALSRVPMQTCMAIFPVGASASLEPREIWVRDLSGGGVGLLDRQPMPIDQEFTIDLPRPDGCTIRMLCAVSYCQRASPSLFTVGARFIQKLA